MRILKTIWSTIRPLTQMATVKSKLLKQTLSQVTIDTHNIGIYDLTGIEAFTGLTALNCNFNGLTSLNISVNTALTYLECQYNSLTNLDVSSNTALTELWCGNNPLMNLNVSSNTALIHLECTRNQLSSLNVSANTSLEWLFCWDNQLTSINVSANTALYDFECGNNQLTNVNVLGAAALKTLVCSNNRLTSLDLSANHVLTALICQNNLLTSLNVKNGNDHNYFSFDARYNPNLFCIQVDDSVYSNNNLNWHKDATTNYSQNCVLAGIANESNDVGIKFYPNPSSGRFTISSTNTTVATQICIYDVLGNCLQNKNCQNDKSLDIDLSSQPKGIYFVEIVSDRERSMRKIVLQ